MIRGKKLDESLINKIKKMREDGFKIKDICKKTGVNKNTVLKYTRGGND